MSANRQRHMGFECGISVFRSDGGMRRGYMGHLTRIANTVVHNLEKGPVHTQISSLIAGLCVKICTQIANTLVENCFLNAVVFVFLVVELPEDYRGRWETFVDQTLSETNRRNTIDLVNTQIHAHLLYSVAGYCNTHTLKLQVWCFFLPPRLALETHAHPQRMI